MQRAAVKVSTSTVPDEGEEPMSESELKVRARRRRALLEEIEQLRRLQSNVVPSRARRARRQQLQRMTRLLA
jgi:hypothetical protein